MRNSVVYLVQCHSNPFQMVEFLATLYNRQDHFILSLDRKAAPALHITADRLKQKFENIYLLDSELISWGGISQVSATLRGISYALQVCGPWTHLFTLSGQDMPLFSPDEIASRLDEGRSYISGSKFDRGFVSQAADLEHRFGMEYQELAGVGCFGVHDRTVEAKFFENLYVGSNWVCLSRQACEVLIDGIGGFEPKEVFKSSLQPDETFIQSFFYTKGLELGLKIEDRCVTFVAAPYNGGGKNMVFNEELYFKAKEKEFFFIRKRPSQLPNSVAEYLRNFPNSLFCTDFVFDFFNNFSIKLERPLDARHRFFLELIAIHFFDRRNGFKFTEINTSTLAGPRFYVQIRHPLMSKVVFVGVLSENYEDFKVSIIIQNFFSFDFCKRHIGGHLTNMVKARIHDIAYAREIYLTENGGTGFVSVKSEADAGELVRTIKIHLDQAVEIGSLFAS